MATVRKVLIKDPGTYRVEKGHQLLELRRKSNSIIITRLILSSEVDILHVNDAPHLRLKNQTLPESLLASACGNPLHKIVETQVLPSDNAIKITTAVRTLSTDTLLRIHWPQVRIVIP